MAFREDLQAFIDNLKKSDNPEDMKKEYRKMVKLYHPDHADQKDKEIYNEYILLINKVYASGKTKTKETEIKSESINKTYVFSKIGIDGKKYDYKCRNYYDYLYKIARDEYDTGMNLLHFHGLSYLDKKALDQNTLEVMQHYWNAIKCLKYLLKNCNDPVILSTCSFEIGMVQNAVNGLSKTIANSEDKNLAIKT